jgi:two-component system response regulator NreC
LLTEEEGCEVVAEAADLGETRRSLEQHHPDVLVLDVNLPDGTGLAAIPELRAACPDTQIVVLTMQDEPAYAQRALTAGALGYVVKEAAESELIEAVRRAAAGQSFLNPRLGARVAAEAPDALSERELDVLRMVALGHTNTEIADMLRLSVRTVETHRAHIHEKLDFASRSELVRYALQHGLMDTNWVQRIEERSG